MNQPLTSSHRCSRGGKLLFHLPLSSELAMTRLTQSPVKGNHFWPCIPCEPWKDTMKLNAHCIFLPSKGEFNHPAFSFHGIHFEWTQMSEHEKTLTYPLREARFSADQWSFPERQLSTYQRILKFLTVIKTWGFPIEGCSQVCNLLFTNVENAIQGKMWQNDHIFLLM